MLEDIAILTGGMAITEDLGRKLESISWPTSAAPSASSIDKDNTTIVEGAGASDDIMGRINLIRRQIEETTSDYDREKLQERLAKLAGGVAVINVGAATEIEMKEKKARVEDALHATRAAVEEGIVPGGGVALLRCQEAVEKMTLEGDEAVGAKIVIRAIEEPLRQFAANAGAEGATVVQNVKAKKGSFGYNAETERIRRPAEGRRHRPDQGRTVGPAERVQRSGPAADHRSAHRRNPRARKGAGTPRRRHGRRRHVLRES